MSPRARRAMLRAARRVKTPRQRNTSLVADAYFASLLSVHRHTMGALRFRWRDCAGNSRARHRILWIVAETFVPVPRALESERQLKPRPPKAHRHAHHAVWCHGDIVPATRQRTCEPPAVDTCSRARLREMMAQNTPAPRFMERMPPPSVWRELPFVRRSATASRLPPRSRS